MRTISLLCVLGALMLSACALPAQAADISPLPDLTVGYMFSSSTSGPAAVLSWEITSWDVGNLLVAANIDMAFGGVTTIESGTLPAAGGIGLTLSDQRKTAHASILYTTRGEVAGFVGWQILTF
ncbi:MAG TPA: hypothetical protein VNA25_30415 [Phycisphaerae bacterium]|nr:hypothetical protein [Phycisphaerae bacterium]